MMNRVLASGGHAIIGTFAPDGLEKSGDLPVTRYDAALLSERLGPGYWLAMSCNHDHHTPQGAVQRFHSRLFQKF